MTQIFDLPMVGNPLIIGLNLLVGLALLLALGIGLVGALVAMFLQRAAIGVAGFLIVGYLAIMNNE